MFQALSGQLKSTPCLVEVVTGFTGEEEGSNITGSIIKIIFFSGEGSIRPDPSLLGRFIEEEGSTLKDMSNHSIQVYCEQNALLRSFFPDCHRACATFPVSFSKQTSFHC